MPRISSIIFGALLVASAAAAQDPLYRAEVHLVTLTFSVRDAQGHLAPGLTADDFNLYEDGVPQKISSFAKEAELPLTIGLIVDVSNSQDKFLKRHNRDIETFLRQILRPQDQVFAICFGNHLRLVSEPTSSIQQVVDGLKRFDKGDRNFPELDPDDSREAGTALYDAVYSSVQEKLAGATNRRRALILFTDGEENSSAHDLLDAIGAAQDADVLVYAVRYTEMKAHQLSAANRHGIAALHHLAQQTGGTDFDALHTDLPQAFGEIADELRSLYSVSYHSTNKARDGTFRKIVLEPKHGGFTVRAKSGYFAR